MLGKGGFRICVCAPGSVAIERQGLASREDLGSLPLPIPAVSIDSPRAAEAAHLPPSHWFLVLVLPLAKAL